MDAVRSSRWRVVLFVGAAAACSSQVASLGSGVKSSDGGTPATDAVGSGVKSSDGGTPAVDAGMHPADGSVPTTSLESPTACSGVTTFQMGSAAGGEWFYSTSGDEEPNWLTIFDAAGNQVVIQPSENSGFNCSDCASGIPVPIGFGGSSVRPGKGAVEGWNGVVFGGAGTCPGAGGCTPVTCAAPGHYVASMCACPTSTSLSSGCIATTPGATCLHVPFDYPSAAPVVGTLPGSDADIGAQCVVSQAGLDVSCKADTDCVAVAFGNPCANDCITPEWTLNAAINVSSLAAYQTALDAARTASQFVPDAGLQFCPPLSLPDASSLMRGADGSFAACSDAGVCVTTL